MNLVYYIALMDSCPKGLSELELRDCWRMYSMGIDMYVSPQLQNSAYLIH